MFIGTLEYIVWQTDLCHKTGPDLVLNKHSLDTAKSENLWTMKNKFLMREMVRHI